MVMSIRDWGEKIKLRWYFLRSRLAQGENTSRYYTAAIIILVGLSSFGLGRLSAIDEKREPIIIEGVKEIGETAPPPAAGGGASTQSASVLSSSPPLGGGDARGGVGEREKLTEGGKLIASRNGTKYYLPWCGSNIAEKNKIWFNSEDEAKAKGYSPAANCKGLK